MPDRSMPDRFREWYDYERDCNAKTAAMLDSVPADRRADPGYPRALAKFAHMVIARWMWLHRLGTVGTRPPARDHFPGSDTLDGVRAQLAEVERAWTEYLASIDEAELDRQLEWSGVDGRRWRWPVERLLVQVFGHAWYHRGQIATLVADLGGTPIDTDYIFWRLPEQVV